MAQWELNFTVDVRRVWGCTSVDVERNMDQEANAILRVVSKVEPRPIRAVYEERCVEMSFIIDVKNSSEAHAQQSRIHDSLSKAIEEAKLYKTYAIEFDPPQEIEEKPRVI